MEAKTAAFDQDMDAQTEKRINDLRANMEVEMNYKEHHTEYVKQLFQSLIEE